MSDIRPAKFRTKRWFHVFLHPYRCLFTQFHFTYLLSFHIAVQEMRKASLLTFIAVDASENRHIPVSNCRVIGRLLFVVETGDVKGRKKRSWRGSWSFTIIQNHQQYLLIFIHRSDKSHKNTAKSESLFSELPQQIFLSFEYSYIQINPRAKMSTLTASIQTRTHLIQFSYTKPAVRRQLFQPSKLKITLSTLDLSEKDTIDLVQDHCFRHFESLNDFYKYVSKNKNKDIVSVDLRGFISIKVLEGKKEIDTETINIYERKRYNMIQEKCDRSAYSQANSKTKQIQKQLRTGRKSGSQDYDHILNFHVVGRDEKFSVHEDKLSTQFPTTLQHLQNRGIQIKINKLRSDMAVVFEVKYSFKQQTHRHECPFGRGYNFALQVDDGNVIEISYEDRQITIMNDNNNNGKVFESQLRDQAQNMNKQIWIGVRLQPQILRQ